MGDQRAIPIQKTATQIAMEQIDYISEVDVKWRVHDFMSVPPRDLFARGITFVFAPQRFESFCTPFFNLRIVIQAIAKMLEMIAEDWRDVQLAKRAMATLHEMDG